MATRNSGTNGALPPIEPLAAGFDGRRFTRMFLVPAIAVVVILAAVWFLGQRDVTGFSSDDAVRHVLRVEHPEFGPNDLVRSTDGRSVMASRRGDAAVAVAFVVGNRRTSRVLSSGDVREVIAVPRAGEVQVTIHTHDLGCPVVRIQLPDALWPAWRARLEALAEGAAPAARAEHGAPPAAVGWSAGSDPRLASRRAGAEG